MERKRSCRNPKGSAFPRDAQHHPILLGQPGGARSVGFHRPGDLFTMRNVGNLIPPATAEGISIGDVSEASAIEYAVLVLKVAHIVVCRHSQCGAMKAVLAR